MTLVEHEVDVFENNSPDHLDYQLRNRVTDYLLDRNEHAFRLLEIDANQGTVTLTGQVRTYYEKQVAASCLSVVGVLNLVNNLTVPEWDTEASDFPFTL